MILYDFINSMNIIASTIQNLKNNFIQSKVLHFLIIESIVLLA